MSTVQLYSGDCLDILKYLPEVDAVVCDPPYGLSFMGKEWDHGVPGIPFWEEVLGAMKPGAHLLAFGGTRTYHRLMVAIEDAGFEIRDCLMWVYGSGFPKSLDVSKAIDRKRDDKAQIYQVTAWIRAARDIANLSNRDIDEAFGFAGMAGHWTSGASQPAVPTLEQIPTLLEVLGLILEEVPDEMRRLIWTLNGRKGQPGEAWGRREVVGQKDVPIGHAFAGPTYGGDSENQSVDKTTAATDAARQWSGWGTALKPAWEPIILARKPLCGTVAANVLEHGTGALNIDACRIEGEPWKAHDATGLAKTKFFTDGETPVIHKEPHDKGRWPANLIHDGSPEVTAGMGEAGSAARFFYCAKASKKDRNSGLVDDERNTHPTVKPTALMRYLCRLVTPPGGTVLDPFMGSGSTGKAAIAEGFNFLGIDLNPEYVEIARARIDSVNENEET